MTHLVVYTIGHSKRNLHDFLDILSYYHIDTIVDVRSIPYSNYANQYNKDDLREFLAKNKIKYVFLGFELGARYLDNNIDYGSIINANKFRTGILKIINLSENHNVCLMCSEYQPTECHRGILISKFLYDKGFYIAHIIEKNEIITQKDVENYLYSEKLRELLERHHKKQKINLNQDETLKNFLEV